MSLFNHPFDLARDAALVTGAGNGIGRAIAQALVGEGVRTVFADVNRETVTAAIKASARPELAVPWIGDLADAAARDAALAVMPGLSTVPAISGALARWGRERLPGAQRARVTLFIGNRNAKGAGAIASAMASGSDGVWRSFSR